MSGNITVAEWQLNRRECIRVSIEQFKGTWLINIRKWFDADDGTIRPSKDGIALRVKHLPQLSDAITRALATAIERGLVEAAGGSWGTPGDQGAQTLFASSRSTADKSTSLASWMTPAARCTTRAASGWGVTELLRGDARGARPYPATAR